MTKKSRTILFLNCVFLFLLACPLTVLYSQGYRVSFDKEQREIKVSKTGGIFVKAYPKQVDIKIEEKSSSKKTVTEKTDFFFGSVLIENLFPKKYNVEITKEGYQAWQKTMEVKEKEVTGIKNIILFKDSKEFSILADNLKDVLFYPNKRKVVLEEQDEQGWALKSLDLASNVKSHLIDDSDLSNKKSELTGLQFSSNEKVLELKALISKETKYFELNLEKNPPALVSLKSPAPATGTDLVSEKLDNDVYALDKEGNLLKNREIISEKPIEIKKETQYALRVSFDFIFLKEGKTIYKFNPGTKSFEKLADNINELKISPGYKTLAYLSDYEIWLFFLKDKDSEPTKKAGESMSLFRVSEKIKDFYWLNEDYLILSIGNSIKVIETDNRDRVQSWEIGNYKDPEVFFNDFDKKVYVFSENKLYCSDVLLP